ncbi:MAG: glycoside hydrolase family 32 protein [bacterium]|nr:glycoside hydrolase family 32 protein [bacterium]
MLDRIVNAFSEYTVILEPDENTPEWWAGAPSACRAKDGTFYLAARMREGNSPRGKRGYEVRILRSEDGKVFEPVAHVKREDAGVPGFERPALVQDPHTGLFRLYGCAGLEGGWSILKWDDAEDPATFDPKTVRTVLVPEAGDDGFARTRGYKDPFVFWDGDRWQMFVIGFDFIERIHHFVSDDGESWRRGAAAPVIENAGWHNFYTRPACVLPMAVGYLLVYEGSHFDWLDPVYNIATGLAYSADLRTFTDLTPDEPLLRSTTPGMYATWRYSHWLSVGDEVYVFFEAARPNNTNEIRLATFKRADVSVKAL